MIAEKPSWIKHEGLQIFTIDVQPGALRFATGGGDHKVRIWSMKFVGRELVNDEPSQRLLATLRNHFGSVNCVRWAKHGRYIASGSDDQVILIHEKKPGSGTTEFGSGEPPDVENWKVAMTLRGHTADVVDLNWSPDDSMLASGSLDNTVHIWNMSSGVCTAVLRGHSSLVKGVTWDPIGSFIASQSDDKTVIIWRTSDWSLAHRTDGHWTKSLGSTFFRRLGWSPCGHFITTTHGFQKPRHSAPVLERGEWSATFDFLGHNAPIIVVKFNHFMFNRKPSNSQDVKATSAPGGWSNGTSKTTGGNESQSPPYNIIAIGSQDRTITVWTTATARPLFVAKHFFAQSVVDLSWSPDGYSLFACSLDGTVATFHFDVKELGYKLTDIELDELKKSRYGDVRGGRQATLAESPAQLLLEAASNKQATTKKVASDIPKNLHPPKSSVETELTSKSLEPKVDNAKKSKGSTGDDSTKVASPAKISSPVKQREYRRPDGRKRIIPEAVGVPARSPQENLSSEHQSQSLGFPPISSYQRMDDSRMVRTEGPVRDISAGITLGGSSSKDRTGASARATITESLVIEKVTVSSRIDGSVNSEQMGILKFAGSLAASSLTLAIKIYEQKEADSSIPICLEARPREHAANDVSGVGNTLTMKETEIVCTRGEQTLWSDRIAGKVTVLAGNSNFWAVGCQDGSLQVYTKCGRRAMPTMMIGSSAVFIDCDESWKLLVVTRKGSLYVWDLFKRTCLIQESLSSLITSDVSSPAKDTGTIKVISAKLSRSGSPLIVLATRHAFLFDTNLKCWVRVADDCFPASNFASSWNMGSSLSGELAALQVDVRKYLARKPGWSRVTDDGVQTRAHLEAQLASSLALESPSEYRHCLLSYIRFLAREADEIRLREVCESFLGPPTGIAEATCSESNNPTWDPYVLGMRKHKLLREDILPAMASNRKVQRLLNEFMDLLSEYTSPETNHDEKMPDASMASAQERNQTAAALPATDPVYSTIPETTDRIDSTLPSANDQMDCTSPITDKVEPPPTINRLSSDKMEAVISLAPQEQNPDS